MTAIALIVTGVVFVLGALALTLQRLIEDEVRAWLPHASRALVRIAVRQLPAGQRQRYEEEWLAELDAYADRPLAALWIAGDLWRGARAMTRERPRASLFARVVAAAFVLLVAPLLALFALLLKLESPGLPIFWHRAFLDENEQPIFEMCFRTCELMDVDHPCPNCGSHKARVLDPERVTRVGAMLQRTDVEVLPRFITVSRGKAPFLPPGASWRDPFDPRRGR